MQKKLRDDTKETQKILGIANNGTKTFYKTEKKNGK